MILFETVEFSVLQKRCITRNLAKIEKLYSNIEIHVYYTNIVV
jgi:hypothetical protein